MKISASIYSSKDQSLQDIVKDLDEHHVDLFHIDCKDDPKVFEDIDTIRKMSTTPLDLHLITDEPERYKTLLEQHPVEYVTFQHEDLKAGIIKNPHGQLGIAITSDTPVDAFDKYADVADFILLMATIPGESGGQFDARNFQKIREFRKKYPGKRIHVDGGVNDEVSFILRNMGVYASVSGSYLFNADTIGAAMLNLKVKESDSHFKVKDFMRQRNDTPINKTGDVSLKEVLETIDIFKVGFTILEDENEVMQGIISNADLRKGMLQHLDDLNKMDVKEIINPTPISINEEATVKDLLRLIKSYSFPILYLPVIDSEHKVKGSVTFLNLIKGEL